MSDVRRPDETSSFTPKITPTRSELERNMFEVEKRISTSDIVLEDFPANYNAMSLILEETRSRKSQSPGKASEDKLHIGFSRTNNRGRKVLANYSNRQVANLERMVLEKSLFAKQLKILHDAATPTPAASQHPSEPFNRKKPQ